MAALRAIWRSAASRPCMLVGSHRELEQGDVERGAEVLEQPRREFAHEREIAGLDEAVPPGEQARG